MSNVNIKPPVHPDACVRTVDPFDSPENLLDRIFHWHFCILQNYVQKIQLLRGFNIDILLKYLFNHLFP